MYLPLQGFHKSWKSVRSCRNIRGENVLRIIVEMSGKTPIKIIASVRNEALRKKNNSSLNPKMEYKEK